MLTFPLLLCKIHIKARCGFIRWLINTVFMSVTAMLTIFLGIATLQGESSTDYGLLMAGAVLAELIESDYAIVDECVTTIKAAIAKYC